MSKESEIAFLESLLATENEEAARVPVTHPASSVLWALTQPERAGDTMVAELREHVSVCASCADLAGRLQAFHDTDPTEPESDGAREWERSERRLDRWMADFLGTQAVPGSPASRPTSRRLSFNWSYWTSWKLGGLRLVTAACVLILLAIGGIELQRGRGANAIDVGQLAPSPPSGKSDPSHAAGVSNNQTVLMNDQKKTAAAEGNDAGQEPLVFSAGEMLVMGLNSVEAQSDGSYRIEGKLLPPDIDKDTLGTVEISGILTPARPGFVATFSAQKIVRNDRQYRPLPALNEEDERPQTVLMLNADGVPRPGETVEMKISRSQTFVVFGP